MSHLTDSIAKLTDSHCHLQLDPLFARITTVLNTAKMCNIEKIVVCGVSPGADWERVESIFICNPTVICPQFGIHPWYIANMEASRDWESELRILLERHPSAGIGECGLDKPVKKIVSVDTQEYIVQRHIALARLYNRPLTLHCVGYWGRLLALLRDEDVNTLEKCSDDGDQYKTCLKIVIHSCNNIPINIAQSLLSMMMSEVYFSFNGCQLLSSKQADMARSLPHDRLLIESDSPDQKPRWEGCNEMLSRVSLDLDECSCNEPCFVTSACLVLSMALSIPLNEVGQLTSENASRVFPIHQRR
jgi:TatD DNase family protein